MKGYAIFGGVRNLLGIAILTFLINLGISTTPALLITVFVGFILYIVQVRMFVGTLELYTIAKMFVLIFFANRIILWVFYDKIGLPIYFAQLISIISLTIFGYTVLRHKHRNMAIFL